jgi:LysM repeat protein
MRLNQSSVLAAAAVLVVGLTACNRDDNARAGPTLPPIRASSTTSTTVVVATTLPEYYEIQRGDTLTAIAAAFQIPVQALMRANAIENPDDIQAGQFLVIPRREEIVADQLPSTAPGQTPPPMPTAATATTSAP